jgi:molecular chaperone GrpE
MWYENTEEKSHKKTREADEDAQEGKTPAVSANSIFPGAQDPTKAFDEDTGGEETPPGEASAEEISALRSKIKELDEKSSMNYDRYLRALAEMENFKKRSAKERAEWMRYAGEDLLTEILPVVDNLERTLAHIRENSDIHKLSEGLNLIYRQFIQALERSGVSRIEEAHRAFDPAIHQALQRVEDKSVADDTVVEILQKGYTLNGKVVRPAMVKVAKHP